MTGNLHITVPRVLQAEDSTLHQLTPLSFAPTAAAMKVAATRARLHTGSEAAGAEDANPVISAGCS
jgi:hypothetical protein